MNDLFEFVVRHGEVVIFLYVFADQIGIPVPAVPGLLAVGALAGAGKINWALALVSSVGASLLADFIWYGIGRARGSHVLGLRAVGALAGAGKINWALALVSSVGASLLADFIWYGLGKARGSQVLG